MESLIQEKREGEKQTEVHVLHIALSPQQIWKISCCRWVWLWVCAKIKFAGPQPLKDPPTPKPQDFPTPNLRTPHFICCQQ